MNSSATAATNVSNITSGATGGTANQPLHTVILGNQVLRVQPIHPMVAANRVKLASSLQGTTTVTATATSMGVDGTETFVEQGHRLHLPASSILSSPKNSASSSALISQVRASA